MYPRLAHPDEGKQTPHRRVVLPLFCRVHLLFPFLNVPADHFGVQLWCDEGGVFLAEGDVVPEESLIETLLCLRSFHLLMDFSNVACELAVSVGV